MSDDLLLFGSIVVVAFCVTVLWLLVSIAMKLGAI